MNKEFEAILSNVAIDTLEKLAFIFASPAGAEKMISTAPCIAARVEFEGLLNGELLIKTSPQVVDEITVNMLGIDEDDEVSLEQRNDAFRELVNIICGNMLPAMAGKEAVFNLKVLEVLTETANIETTLKGQAKPVAVANLDIDCEPCDLYLFIDED